MGTNKNVNPVCKEGAAVLKNDWAKRLLVWMLMPAKFLTHELFYKYAYIFAFIV